MAVYVNTKELEIRPFTESDVQAMGKMLTDNQIKRTYMIPDLESREAVERLFSRFLALSRTEGRYVAGVYLQDQLIGFINDVENDGVRIELGYVIAPTYQGKGYGTQMLSGVIEDLFCRGYQEVAAGAFEENAASIRVMIKSGMTKLPQEEDIEYRGQVHRCVYYSVKKQ